MPSCSANSYNERSKKRSHAKAQRRNVKKNLCLCFFRIRTMRLSFSIIPTKPIKPSFRQGCRYHVTWTRSFKLTTRGAIKSDAHESCPAFENTLGVQGLPCLLAPSQGKPCTPASLLIAPVDKSFRNLELAIPGRWIPASLPE